MATSIAELRWLTIDREFWTHLCKSTIDGNLQWKQWSREASLFTLTQTEKGRKSRNCVLRILWALFFSRAIYSDSSYSSRTAAIMSEEISLTNATYPCVQTCVVITLTYVAFYVCMPFLVHHHDVCVIESCAMTSRILWHMLSFESTL